MSGWIQVISDFENLEAEFAMLRQINERTKRLMAITILQRDSRPELWRDLFREIVQAKKNGAQLIGQMLSRPIGLLLGFEIPLNPFIGRPSWEEISHLSLEKKLVHLRNQEIRKRVISETCASMQLAARVTNYDRIFPWNEPVPDYGPPAEQSIAIQTKREGRRVEDLVYDILLEKAGKTILYRPLSNFAYGNLIL